MAVDPARRHPDIHRWATQLQELADATGLSLRQLAEHVPWSHSTLARYLNGDRVVDEAWRLVRQLVDLGTKRGSTSHVDVDELHQLYLRARQAYQEQQRTHRIGLKESASGEAKPEESQNNSLAERNAPEPAKWIRPLFAMSAVAIAMAGLFGVSLYAGWGQSGQTVWRANIVGTWSEEYHQHLGVFRFRTPDLPGDTDKSTYHEHTAVAIVCQARHRRVVFDPTTGTSSPVWNKLSDGVWIPDLYTDLPKVAGETPPLGIPTCS